MLNFAKPQQQNANRKYIKQVTGWVEDALPDSYDPDAMVMVNEMQCFEPVRSWTRAHPACTPLVVSSFASLACHCYMMR